MSEQYVNSVSTTLSAAITTAGQSSIVVTSATGFPSSGNFRILIATEIMIVTAVSGTTWTVTRSAEGTEPCIVGSGTLVEHIITAGALDAIRQDFVTVGPYANLPAPGTNRVGDIYIPTDSFYDTIRYNGSTWDHFLNGRLLTPPVNSAYTWDNTGNGTVDATKGGVVAFSSQAINSQLQVRYKTAPATPYTITVAFLAHFTATNFSSCGLGWRDSTGKIVTMSTAWNSSWLLRAYKFNSSVSYNSDYTSVAMPPLLIHPGLIWMRITNNGTNRTWEISSNGINWTLMHTVASTDFVNATGTHQVHFCWGDANADVGMTLLHWKET